MSSSSFLTVMPAVATITEFLRTADEAGRAMVIGILQQTISAAGGDVAPMALSIKAPSASAGGAKTPKAKTPRVLAPEVAAAKSAFMAGLVAEVKAVQTEMGSSYKEAQTEVAIRKIMKEEAKTHEEADEIYAERSAAKQAKAKARKEAKAAGLPTPRAPRTPKSGEAKTPKADASGAKAPKVKKASASASASEASSPVAEAHAGGAIAPAAALSIRAPVSPKVSASAEPKKVKKAKKTEEPEANMKAQFTKMGLEETIIDGQTVYFNSDSLEVFEKKGEYVLGDRLGVYNPETEEIDEADE